MHSQNNLVVRSAQDMTIAKEPLKCMKMQALSRYMHSACTIPDRAMLSKSILRQNTLTLNEGLQSLLSQNPFGKKPATFNNLPVELLLCIADLSTLPDAIALALTCKEIHGHLEGPNKRRWMKSNSMAQGLCLLTMSQTLPSLKTYYVCSDRPLLQRIDLLDLPYKPRKPGSPFVAIDGRPCCSWLQTRNSFSTMYKLQYHHVALALQYRMLKQCNETEISNSDVRFVYLDALLKPLNVIGLAFIPEDDDDYSFCEVWMEFSAKPSIRENKFILETCWRFNGLIPGEDLPTVDESGQPFRICPHQSYGNVYMTVQLILVAEVNRALHGGCPGRQFSCLHCATDFLVDWCPCQSTLIIRVWQSLGKGGYPLDAEWCMQMYESDEKNVEDGVYHVPGSVRRLVEQKVPR